jgi:hypothetical protein
MALKWFPIIADGGSERQIDWRVIGNWKAKPSGAEALLIPRQLRNR